MGLGIFFNCKFPSTNPEGQLGVDVVIPKMPAMGIGRNFLLAGKIPEKNSSFSFQNFPDLTLFTVLSNGQGEKYNREKPNIFRDFFRWVRKKTHSVFRTPLERTHRELVAPMDWSSENEVKRVSISDECVGPRWHFTQKSQTI